MKNQPGSPSKVTTNGKNGANAKRPIRPSFADNIYGGSSNTPPDSPVTAGSPSKVDVQMNNAQSPTSNSPGVQLSESALAQRRSAYLPKLRQLSSNVTNLSFEHGLKKFQSLRHEIGEINFTYADCDTYGVELSELYSYSEVTEWTYYLETFTLYMEAREVSPIWMALDKSEKQDILADMVQRLEQTNGDERIAAARILLYILQGAYIDFEEPISEVVADAMEEARSHIQYANEEDFLEQFCLLQAACNAYLAYDAGVFKVLCEVLQLEAHENTDENSPFVERTNSAASNTRSGSSTDGPPVSWQKMKMPTISENEMLRLLFNSLYHMIEAIRRPEVLANCTHVSDFSASRLEQLRNQFIKELHEPIECINKQPLLFFMDMIPPFIRGASVRFPIKKIVLCTWKVMLATFGDTNTLRDLKAQRRRENGLPPIEDTFSTALRLRSTNFSADGQFAESTGTKIQRRYRGGMARGAFNRQQALTTTQLSEEATSPKDEKLPDEEDIGPVVTGGQPPIDGPSVQKSIDEKDTGRDTPALGQSSSSNNGGLRTPNGGEQTPTASSPLPSVLPWTSKVKQCEVEQFIQNERLKFCGFRLPRDSTSLFGLPAPVQKSVEALRRHVFVSLGEKQIADEKLYNKYPFSRKEEPVDNPVENVYMRMIPNMPTDAICFLKILLASIPSTKIQGKSDITHILSDVLTSRCPDATDLLSTSLNLDVSASTHNILEDAIRLAIDINRHKEIIVKSASALVIGLLKFFRQSHIYEFENLSQQLVLTNCLPLILKFMDQNMAKYFQSKNELAPLNYPHAVVHYARNNREWPVLNADNVGADQTDHQSYFLWRNVFGSVNLIRILNKLTKNKHSRTMMLVVFKSTPILKRCLKLRCGIFQFYILKLLKMQARYLGRQWRRTNMEVISAIYMKLRHRLNDDWAFANETRCKQWDFQEEERELKAAIERFNLRRYGHLYPDQAFQMDVKDSISGVAGANAGKLLGAPDLDDDQMEEDEEEEEEDDFDIAEFQPVDNNLCSVLGEQVEFTSYFKQNYEKWLEDVVFRNPVNWDDVLMPTEQLEKKLKEQKI